MGGTLELRVGTVKITEIRIKLMEGSEDRLRAFCSITIEDSFVIRDLKIIDGSSGPFVAMPSRKLTGHCPRCHYKNHLRAHFCNQCGAKLHFDSKSGLDSPQKLYADIAHPINSQCREEIQSAVVEEFNKELARAAEPGYRSRYDDEFPDHDTETAARSETPARPEPMVGSNSSEDEPDEDTATLHRHDVKPRSSMPEPPPRPHFIDGGTNDGVSSAPVSSSPGPKLASGRRGSPAERSAPVQDDEAMDDGGFGAGIFDD